MAPPTIVDPELDPSATYAVDPSLVRRLTSRVVCAPRPQYHLTTTPLNGAPIGALPLSSPADVVLAYDAAKAAQRRWARTPLEARAAILLRVHDLVLDRQDEILDLLQIETGKARRHAFDEVGDIALIARHYARVGPSMLRPRRRVGLLPVLTSSVQAQRPIGVVGIVAPWNYPFALAIGDLIPALLAGNGVLLRPDLQTSLTVLHGVDLLIEAGVPEGVIQVVLGDGASIGQAVVDTADYVAFTGSTSVGRRVGERAGQRLIGYSLELGGKNSLYVRADADLDRAVTVAVSSSFASAGQLCVHTERIVVDEAVADDFTHRFLAAVREMRLGVELRYGFDMGALMSSAQVDRVSAHVADASANGATVLVGGQARPDIAPTMYEPTVLADVTPVMACYAEETFGPVVAIHRVDGDDAALELINDTQYGLHTSVFTRDVKRGRSLARRLRTGMVSINDGYSVCWGSVATPMGGMKNSGVGRRHGEQGLLRFTQTQNVTVQRGPVFGPIGSMSDEEFVLVMTRVLRAMKALGRH